MAFLHFGKKKEEKTTCGCSCNASAQENTAAHECCGKSVDGVCCIKVLGGGCKSCHQLYENAQSAVSSLGLSVEVEYITDMAKVMEYGAMSMPALVVNETVVSMGKVLKAAEIAQLLHKLGA